MTLKIWQDARENLPVYWYIVPENSQKVVAISAHTADQTGGDDVWYSVAIDNRAFDDNLMLCADNRPYDRFKSDAGIATSTLTSEMRHSQDCPHDAHAGQLGYCVR